MLADRVMRGEEGSEFQARHGFLSGALFLWDCWSQTTGWQQPRQSHSVFERSRHRFASRKRVKTNVETSDAAWMPRRWRGHAVLRNSREPEIQHGNLTKSQPVVAPHSRTEGEDPGTSVAGRAGIFITIGISIWIHSAAAAGERNAALVATCHPIPGIEPGDLELTAEPSRKATLRSRNSCMNSSISSLSMKSRAMQQPAKTPVHDFARAYLRGNRGDDRKLE
jgi:hypothetical protein